MGNGDRESQSGALPSDKIPTEAVVKPGLGSGGENWSPDGKAREGGVCVCHC